MVATITNYGGLLTALHVPDRHGQLDDVTLGYDALENYREKSPYFGALVGRYGNRIANGRFVLNGREYTLAQNNGTNSLHGGVKGFDKVVWNAEAFQHDEGVGLKLHRLSPDGEEGYPGNLDVTVIYTLTDQNELRIEYSATTDRETIVNLTHHSYFNLLGATSGRDILGHEILINADYFTPVTGELIPTGELRPVKGTPMDFTSPRLIGSQIDEDDEQLALTSGGYDHNWVLNRTGEHLSLAARVYEPETGRVLEVRTTEPGIQFYIGNFLDGSIIGKGGVAYHKYAGFCLETQHFPNSPNQPNFPSTVLKPDDTYTQTTVYAFSVK